MYINDANSNKNTYWKPQTKYQYKSSHGVQVIKNGREKIEVNKEAHFSVYSLDLKQELDPVESVEFLCLRKLYKYDSQEFASNYDSSNFEGVFKLRDKQDGFKLVDTVRWDANKRKFLGESGAEYKPPSTVLVGLDEAGDEVEIGLNISTTIDLLKYKIDGEINPKAEIMNKEVALILRPSPLIVTIGQTGTHKFLDPSPSEKLKVSEFNKELKALNEKIEKMLNPEIFENLEDVLTEVEEFVPINAS